VILPLLTVVALPAHVKELYIKALSHNSR